MLQAIPRCPVNTKVGGFERWGVLNTRVTSKAYGVISDFSPSYPIPTFPFVSSSPWLSSSASSLWWKHFLFLLPLKETMLWPSVPYRLICRWSDVNFISMSRRLWGGLYRQVNSLTEIKLHEVLEIIALYLSTLLSIGVHQCITHPYIQYA